MKQNVNKTTVRFGDLEWTTKNLESCYFSNGDFIPFAASKEEFLKYSKNGLPCRHFLDFNDQKMNLGFMYNEFAVKDSRGLGKDGFRVPTENEWKQIFQISGYLFEEDESHLWGSTVSYNQARKNNNIEALKDLKASKAWKTGKHKGTNKSFFSALPTNEELTICSWATKNFIERTSGSIFMGSNPNNRQIEVNFQTHDNSLNKQSFKQLLSNSAFVRLVRISDQHKQSVFEIDGKRWEKDSSLLDLLKKNKRFHYIDNKNKWEEAKKNGQPAYCFYNNNLTESSPLLNWHSVKDLVKKLPNGIKIANSNDYQDLFNSLSKNGNELRLLDVFHWKKYFIHFSLDDVETNSNNFGIQPLGCRIPKYITHWEGEALYSYEFTGKGTYAIFWTADSYLASFSIKESKISLKLIKIKSDSEEIGMGCPILLLKK